MPLDIDVPANTAITATQELCGIVSPISRAYFAASERSGRWFVVEDDNGGDLKADAFAAHAALSHSEYIVIFSGDQHNPAQNTARPQDLNHCQLFDCATLTLTSIDAPTTDVFCAGHAFLPDGRLLVAGGTEKFPPGEGDHHAGHFPGLADAWLFSPTPGVNGRHWTKVASMHGGRWYPTLLTLANGHVLALSGHPQEADTRHNNNSMETFDPTGGWTYLGDSAEIASNDSEYLYPRILVGPDRHVYSATPLRAEPTEDPGRSGTWDPGAGTRWSRSAAPIGTWGLRTESHSLRVLCTTPAPGACRHATRTAVSLPGHPHRGHHVLDHPARHARKSGGRPPLERAGGTQPDRHG